MQKRILSFILSISILFNLVGCERKNYSNNKNSMYALEELTGYEDLEKWIREINKIEPEYDYSEYYFTEEDLEEVFENAKTTEECDNKNYNSYEELYRDIVKNNKNVVGSPFSYINSDNEEDQIIYQQFSIALYKALYNIFDGKENIYEDCCKLKDTQIIIKDLNNGESYSFIFGKYFTNENIIGIDYQKCLEYFQNQWYSTINFEEFLTQILQHEINHTRQNACDCRLENGQEYLSTSFQNTKNGEAYRCFLGIKEASAESQLYSDELNKFQQKYSTSYFTYEEERKIQSLLFLLGMFKKDFTLEKYYDALYNSDLSKLYEIYKLEDIEDVTMFYNIVYALETKVGRTPLYTVLSKDAEKIDSTYKIYIFREVIKDLIKRINDGDLSLKETIYLYDYVKSYIIYDEKRFLNYEERIVGYDEEFMNSVVFIENVFYDYISNYYGYSIDKIKEGFATDGYSTSRYIGNDILEKLLNYNSLMESNYTVSDDDLFVKSLIEKFPIMIELSFSYKIDIDVYSFEHQYEETLKRKSN